LLSEYPDIPWEELLLSEDPNAAWEKLLSEYPDIPWEELLSEYLNPTDTSASDVDTENTDTENTYIENTDTYADLEGYTQSEPAAESYADSPQVIVRPCAFT
jgi:hypothetical protein